MRRMILAGLVAVLGLISVESVVAQQAKAPPIEPGQKWVFEMGNLATDAGRDALFDLAKRAAKAGYNGFMLSDIKLDKFQLQGDAYLKNLKEFRALCKELKLKFIPCVMPFGYSDAMLSNDPNLAEGMPVRDAMFVVEDAKLVPFDDTTKVINGSFEQWKKHVPVGWSVDSPGELSFRDDQVQGEGNSSLRQSDVAKHRPKVLNGRLSQMIKVKPWHYYRISVKIKTENCTNQDWRIMAFTSNHVTGLQLTWQPPSIQPTQDWTEYNVTFCSIDQSEVTLYLGCWHGKAGTVWWDDVKVEPAGFVNILRRDSQPLVVTSPDKQTIYEEGRDFSKIVDPKLGHDPNPGYFTNWHDAPVVSIPEGSRLTEGDQVLASYHFAMTCGKPNNINMCMSEPKTYEIIENQIRWLKENCDPDIYQLAHDEIRLNGWDASCTKTGKTNGQILAENIRKCVEIVKTVDPGKPIMVWNDMFDPNHNARTKNPDGTPFVHYMSKDNWSGSWEGLTSDVAVGTWLQQSVPSVEFWSDRNHQVLLLGYYDADPSKIVEWLKSTEHCRESMIGVMYTSWVHDFTKLETFIELVNDYEEKNPAASSIIR